MKKVITLISAVICLSFVQHPKAPVTASSPSKDTTKVAAIRPAFFNFPTDVNWSISYFQGLPMITLTWPAFTLPGLGPVSFTILGSTQYIDPTTTTSIYWAGTGFTLTPNTSYTLSLGGTSYYFYWVGGNSSQCIITGHS
jgi:hypothetical protein